jgi:hypothetical protein
VVIPPALSSFEAFLATHLRPHGGEVRVAGFDAPTYELAATSDRVGHDLHQFVAGRTVEPVGIRDNTQSCWPVCLGRVPARERGR